MKWLVFRKISIFFVSAALTVVVALPMAAGSTQNSRLQSSASQGIAKTEVEQATDDAVVEQAVENAKPEEAAEAPLQPSPPSGTSVLPAVPELMRRERLVVCIQGIGSAASAAALARQRIQPLLPAITSHPRWVVAGYNSAAPLLQDGCSREPLLLMPGVLSRDGHLFGEQALPRQTRSASFFQVFIFIVPEEILRPRLQGARDVRVAPQELLCEGHVCVESGVGLYFTPSDLQNETFLRGWLIKAAGIESYIPTPTPRPPLTRTPSIPGRATTPARSPRLSTATPSSGSPTPSASPTATTTRTPTATPSPTPVVR